jgi:hypothetical protein
MPVKNPGSYPTSSDVFYSPNIFINGVNVALWKAPSKGPTSGSKSTSSGGVNAQQDDTPQISSSASATFDKSVAEQTNSVPSVPTSDLQQPETIPPNSGLSGAPAPDNGLVLSSQTPEAPSTLPTKTVESYATQMAAYVANPDSYKMKIENVLTGNIKSTFPGTLRNLSLDPLESIAPKEAVIPLGVAFQTLVSEGLDGAWKETGTQGFQSNRNIIGIFADMGYDTNIAPFNSDQTPWSMALVNWVLKRSGYRYTTTLDAYDIMNRASDYGAVEVPLSEARVGDICLWDYGHANFVYQVFPDGKMSFLGGCQSLQNEPNSGTISVSWSKGYDPVNNNGSLLKVFRPTQV